MEQYFVIFAYLVLICGGFIFFRGKFKNGIKHIIADESILEKRLIKSKRKYRKLLQDLKRRERDIVRLEHDVAQQELEQKADADEKKRKKFQKMTLESYLLAQSVITNEQLRKARAYVTESVSKVSATDALVVLGMISAEKLSEMKSALERERS